MMADAIVGPATPLHGPWAEVHTCLVWSLLSQWQLAMGSNFLWGTAGGTAVGASTSTSTKPGAGASAGTGTGTGTGAGAGSSSIHHSAWPAPASAAPECQLASPESSCSAALPAAHQSLVPAFARSSVASCP